ncbi:MAG: Maf family protein, partial [Nannocystaceae bacterium]
MHLLLASASPRRRNLLAQAGVAQVVHPVDCDESWQTGEHPEAYTRRLALAKAQLAQADCPEHKGPILGADTTVW